MTYAHEALIVLYVYAPLAAVFSVGCLRWLAWQDEKRWPAKRGGQRGL